MYCFPLADDCGVSEDNVAAIAQCLDAGCLRGASIMANGAAVLPAAAMLGERLRRGAALRVGAHLNLLEGYCSAPANDIPLLADADGRFRHSLGGLCLLLCRSGGVARRALNEQAALEWRAQIRAIRDALTPAAGRDVPLYLDGHQHVHAIPALRQALLKVLADGPFTHVRVPEEARYRCPAPAKLAVTGTARRELLAFWGRSLRRFLVTEGVAAPDFFIGAFCSGQMTAERLEAGLRATAALAGESAVVEIMLHPGRSAARGKGDDDIFVRFYAAPERDVETGLLLSPWMRETLAAYDPTWGTMEPGRVASAAV